MHPFNKSIETVLGKKLAQVPCLVLYTMFQLLSKKIDSQILQTSTSSNVAPELSRRALGESNGFSSAA